MELSEDNIKEFILDVWQLINTLKCQYKHQIKYISDLAKEFELDVKIINTNR